MRAIFVGLLHVPVNSLFSLLVLKSLSLSLSQSHKLSITTWIPFEMVVLLLKTSTNILTHAHINTAHTIISIFNWNCEWMWIKMGHRISFDSELNGHNAIRHLPTALSLDLRKCKNDLSNLLVKFGQLFWRLLNGSVGVENVLRKNVKMNNNHKSTNELWKTICLAISTALAKVCRKKILSFASHQPMNNGKEKRY